MDFFYPPFPYGKISSPSLLLPELVLFCKKKKAFLEEIVKEYSVWRKSPHSLLDAAATCILWRVVGGGHPLGISTSIQACPLFPVVLGSTSKLWAEGRQEGGGYVSHTALSLLVEVWVPVNTQAEHIGLAPSGCLLPCQISDFPSAEYLWSESYCLGESNSFVPSVPQCICGVRVGILGNHSFSGLLCPCSVLLPVLQSLQPSPWHHRGLYPIHPQALHRQCHCWALLHKGCGEMLFI